MDADTLNSYWTDLYFLLHGTYKEKVTHQAIRIMQLVEKREDVSISDVAAFLNISHNTASENVKRIIEKKYLIKNRDDFDERKIVLKLTELGREVLQRHTSLDNQKLSKILHAMTVEELELIDSAFKLLKDRAKHVHTL